MKLPTQRRRDTKWQKPQRGDGDDDDDDDAGCQLPVAVTCVPIYLPTYPYKTPLLARTPLPLARVPSLPQLSSVKTSE